MTQEEAMKQLKGKRNILLIGPGGTGKTTLLKKYIEESDENIIVCAPTGTAAANIGGATIHRTFSVPIMCRGVPLSDVPAKTIKTLSLADVVIIDEISMCRCDVFSFMARVLHAAQRKKGSKIRLICSGDFMQLPPVVNDVKELRKYGFDPSGFPFTTKEWSGFHFKPVELTEIMRQKDKEFIEHLNEIRIGNKNGLDYFNQFLISEERPAPEKSVYICGTNAMVGRINNAHFQELEGELFSYQTETTGNPSISFNPVNLYKIGERVIFDVNDVEHNEFQNGTTGVIIAADKKKVTVQKDDGKVIDVYPHTWISYAYKERAGTLTKEKIGTTNQIPLSPAWAITIHKAQGKTFDKAVISPQTFAPGQLYVALSRVRNPEGLYLMNEILPEYVITDKLVQKFAKNGYKWDNPTSNTVTAKKRKVSKPAVSKKTGTKKQKPKKKARSSAKTKSDTKKERR